jgi:hypothetical protein
LGGKVKRRKGEKAKKHGGKRGKGEKAKREKEIR